MIVQNDGISKQYALITGGGTKAYVDAVRSMSNDAEGDIAVEIARRFSRRDIPSLLILSRFAWFKHRNDLPKDATVIQFVYVDQYLAAIAEAVSKHGHPAFAVSTAAVCDYGYLNPVAGKISSDKETLDLSLPRLPKVLDGWREQFGRKCIIVGFKFLTKSNATREDLFAAARRQNARARLNATVANFKEEIGVGKHPVWWVTPDGGTVRLDGWRDEVAKHIVDYAVRYRNTTWARSEREGEIYMSDFWDLKCATVASNHLIEFCLSANLFDGTAGNFSASVSENALLVSPRAADKASVRPKDMLVASLDAFGERVVRFNGPVGAKPSIDTHVLLLLQRDLPFCASLHVHGAWMLGGVPVTRTAFPCGTAQQAAMIEETIARTIKHHSFFGENGNILVELRDHGHLFLFKDMLSIQALKFDWESARDAYIDHLREVGQENARDRLTLRPIFDAASIVGVVAQTVEGWHSFFLLPEARGRRLGDDLIDLVNRRGARVAVHEGCAVRDFYVDRGFDIVKVDGAPEGVTVLDPPSVRTDVREAVTLCLHCVRIDRVLLVRRPSGGSYPDKWACPGGSVDGHDSSPYGTGVRETWEEVKIDLSHTVVPDSSTVHYTGWRNPATGMTRASRVTNYVVKMLVEPAPRVDGAEIVEAGWVTREEARSLPMGQATRAVLRKVWPDF